MKSQMREIFTSGSVRGLIATSGAITPIRGALWALLDTAQITKRFMADVYTSHHLLIAHDFG